jgi:hypothetical protein
VQTTIESKETTSLFERLQLSVRESFFVLATFARSSGENFQNLKLSVSTVYRMRKKNRTIIAEEVKILENEC